MLPSDDRFRQTIRRQIAINQARTPTERFLALCDLLDAARAMAPKDPAARERRLRAKGVRDREREQSRAEYRRLLASQRSTPPSGV
jgi:hypothetical protein